MSEGRVFSFLKLLFVFQQEVKQRKRKPVRRPRRGSLSHACSYQLERCLPTRLPGLPPASPHLPSLRFRRLRASPCVCLVGGPGTTPSYRTSARGASGVRQCPLVEQLGTLRHREGTTLSTRGGAAASSCTSAAARPWARPLRRVLSLLSAHEGVLQALARCQPWHPRFSMNRCFLCAPAGTCPCWRQHHMPVSLRHSCLSQFAF